MRLLDFQPKSRSKRQLLYHIIQLITLQVSKQGEYSNLKRDHSIIQSNIYFFKYQKEFYSKLFQPLER